MANGSRTVAGHNLEIRPPRRIDRPGEAARVRVTLPESLTMRVPKNDELGIRLVCDAFGRGR